MEFEKESGNFVKITLKKSSSSGSEGFDIDVKSDGKITQEELNLIGAKSLTTALKIKSELQKRGL